MPPCSFLVCPSVQQTSQNVPAGKGHQGSKPGARDQHSSQVHTPEKAVEVTVSHVLNDHEQWAALGADSKEAHNVLVLQHGEQLSLALEVLPRTLRHLLQSLMVERTQD